LAALVQGTNGNLYGTTLGGGASSACPGNCGTVFEITPNGTLTTLYSFCAQSGCTGGEKPNAALIQATNGSFYGTAREGGANNDGTVFRIAPSGTLTTLHSFDNTDGDFPVAGLIQATNGNFYGTTEAGGAYGLGMVFKITPSGALTTLHSFDGADGEAPLAGVVEGTDGNFYGTTSDGGASGYAGTAFKITPSGTLTTLYSFCSQSNCTDGFEPFAALVQATNGNFYGTTYAGGANSSACPGNCGTVFEITPNGTLTTLYSFCAQTGCTDGGMPSAALIQATDGNFYGTASGGGSSGFAGTLFKITSSGVLTTLYSFCSQSDCTDGATPSGGLVQATDGNLYGTTEMAGANPSDCFGAGCGTVFKITPRGSLSTLHSFDSTDGAGPTAGLIQATDGNFYGTTNAGGAISPACAEVVQNSGCGTVFEITPSGTLTTLHSFCAQTNCTDGSLPLASLAQATDGNLYGTTEMGGGPHGDGTVFKITTGGTLTTVHSFFCSVRNCTGGDLPTAALIQDTSGGFYGTTCAGGNDPLMCPSGCGTVFTLSVGLGPFVETEPNSGKVGRSVKILGTDLTGATSVTFNGTAAVFKVDSGSLISTIVPAGATTGALEVVTPSGALSSNVKFRVAP
jgi:uncharacterized repeat protein (TIGR03803 family)